jgi:hypothetical protein
MKKRTCVKCKKEFLEKDGILVLRGISFVCKACHKKDKAQHKDAEVCEFC